MAAEKDRTAPGKNLFMSGRGVSSRRWVRMAAEKDRQARKKLVLVRARSQLKAEGQNGRGKGPPGPRKNLFWPGRGASLRQWTRMAAEKDRQAPRTLRQM